MQTCTDCNCEIDHEDCGSCAFCMNSSLCESCAEGIGHLHAFVPRGESK